MSEEIALIRYRVSSNQIGISSKDWRKVTEEIIIRGLTLGWETGSREVVSIEWEEPDPWTAALTQVAETAIAHDDAHTILKMMQEAHRAAWNRAWEIFVQEGRGGVTEFSVTVEKRMEELQRGRHRDPGSPGAKADPTQ